MIGWIAIALLGAGPLADRLGVKVDRLFFLEENHDA